MIGMLVRGESLTRRREVGVVDGRGEGLSGGGNAGGMIGGSFVVYCVRIALKRLHVDLERGLRWRGMGRVAV
jgi:hypothetical protein